MHFEMSKRAKRDFWYDFATGEESEELPSSAQELAPLPQALMPEYKTEIVPQTNVREIIKNVKVLSFKSWWYEDIEEPTLGDGSSAGGGLKKRYTTLEYDLFSKNFRVILEENVAIDLADMQSHREVKVECWDLYIGANINILGKRTTLQQGSLETIQWLDFYAAQLMKLKDDLEKTLHKYTMESFPASWCFTLRSKPGCCNLRHLMYQIEQLKAELSKYRPKLAQTYSTEEVLKSVP